MNKILPFFFLLVAVLFFVYSYGFVDLNLTLSSHPLVFDSVSFLQKLVYFNRPLSANIFLSFIALLFVLYGLMLAFLPLKKFPWKFVVILSVLFALSYPAGSSDVYKYLFSARMIVEYGANPHLVTPDTFPADTWIRFMRWVHTPSPYGPVATAYALPFYLLGFGKFVPVLFLYKLAQVGWYLLTIWLIGKLSHSARAQLFFAANPLILMEWLGNAHNDAPMITLLLLSLYLLTLKRRISSFFALTLSIGIKYVTVIFLPLIFLRKYNLRFTLYFLLLTLFSAPLLYKYSFQYQPWYVTWLVPFAAILGNSLVLWLVAAYTLGSLLRYLPFVATGLWSATPLQFALLSFLPPLIVLLTSGSLWVIKKLWKKNT